MTDIPRTFRFDDGLEVNRIGYGAMRLTGQPRNFGPYPDWAGGIALLRRAADLGVDLFDSAWAYGPEDADRLLGEALEGRDVAIATKGGVTKTADAVVTDGRPETLHRQIERALVNLRRERIDLYQLHRVDPDVPIEDSVGAILDARAAGKVRHVGLSNVDREQVDRARATGPVAAIQNRFNRDDTDDDALVDFAAGAGIAFLPHGPLGANPMKQGAALPPAEALAWLLRRSPNVVVIPGTTSVAHLEENVRAWEAV